MKDELIVLERNNDIEIWDDRALIAGDRFNDEIRRELDEAEIVCFLVSVDFIKSNYIWSLEMDQAIKRHVAGEVKIVPIVLKKVPNFNKLPFAQLISLPKDAKPIEEHSKKEEAWAYIGREITRLVEQTQAEKLNR